MERPVLIFLLLPWEAVNVDCESTYLGRVHRTDEFDGNEPLTAIMIAPFAKQEY